MLVVILPLTLDPVAFEARLLASCTSAISKSLLFGLLGASTGGKKPLSIRSPIAERGTDGGIVVLEVEFGIGAISVGIRGWITGLGAIDVAFVVCIGVDDENEEDT